MARIFNLLILVCPFMNAQPQLYDFSYGEDNRQYYLYTPDSLEAGAALIFVFHGYSGSAAGIMGYSDLNDLADQNGFVVCYPQGLIDDWGNRFWSVGYEFHSNETHDDVGFVKALAYYLQVQYQLSSYNTYSTGMSNGGDMSYLLACQASDVFRAVAPVAGCMMTWIYDSCEPIRPIPVFEIHGTDDDVTWWEGADENNNDGWGPWESVDTTFNFWTEINECTEYTVDTLPNVNPTDGSFVIGHKNIHGINDNEVWLYEVVNGGHDWPGAWGNMDINASAEIWGFLDQFSITAEIGDINFDQTINILDMLLISDGIMNDQPYNYIEDYNHDSEINTLDIIFIGNFILDF